MKKFINSPVAITAYGFGRNMRVIPRRMEWQGRMYRFIDMGIHVASRRGEHAWSTVTMSDGRDSFCLRFDGTSWTLLSIG